MILYGASGHGRVIADILRQSGESRVRFWDDSPEAAILGYEVAVPEYSTEEEVILAIGSNRVRKMLAARLGIRFGKAIHPSAVIGEYCDVGDGSVVMAGAILNPGTTVGRHCIINTAASVDHDGRIGDYVHISPGVVLTGNVSVGDGAHIGAGAVVIPGTRIGQWAVIGAGAVIIRDVPDYAVVVGNPGKIIRYDKNI